ncbi:CPBP family intramembrane glutamic endopeptidase [Halobaculum sp. MBLA0143]|uniref:CPBP family intramembrane glutamic endopeptidase n=1 Tax=Halobaculum sp. MBLA0143 TaxID=3079933 RepID=UPI0035264293
MTAGWSVLLGLVVALGGDWAVGKLSGWVTPSDRSGDDDTVTLNLTKWLGLVPMLAWVFAVEGAGLGSLTGTRLPPLALVAVVAGGVVVTFTASAVIQRVTSAFGIDGVAAGGTIQELSDRSTAGILLTAVTAGVTEELLFRGFLVERLVSLTGSHLLAGAVSVVVFGAVHYRGWGLEETVEITMQGAVLVGIYLLVPSVVALIAIHALHDGLGLLLARRAVTDDRTESAAAAES